MSKRPQLPSELLPRFLALYAEGAPMAEIVAILEEAAPGRIPSAYRLGSIAHNKRVKRPEGFVYDRGSARRQAPPLVLRGPLVPAGIVPVTVHSDRTERLTALSTRELRRQIIDHFAPVSVSEADVRQWAQQVRVFVFEDGERIADPPIAALLEVVNARRAAEGLPPFRIATRAHWEPLPRFTVGGGGGRAYSPSEIADRG